VRQGRAPKTAAVINLAVMANLRGRVRTLNFRDDKLIDG
jgi:hypothetical protein